MRKIINYFEIHGLKLMLASLVIIIISILLPLPVYVEQPGSAKDLSDNVEISDKKPDLNGEYMITSVGIKRVNIWGVASAMMSPHKTLLSEDDVLGGATMQQDQALNALYMSASINQAKVNAYHEAKIPYKRVFQGIYVLNIQANSNFSDVLSLGDTITAVDGKKFTNTVDFQKYIQSKKVGENIRLTFEHAGEEQTATRKTIGIGEKQAVSGIGIALAEDASIEGSPDIDADMGSIGGPSGGLMLTLEMTDALTDQDLARGRKIAGTGTIDNDGNVGEIGGIDKKIIAARDAGATIFLAPYVASTKAYREETGNTQTNYEVAKATAKEYAPDLTVVPVKTLAEAISYLRK
ncbi:PDZ domain-containing protein [Weissella ceti]|uniref:endopeptidase La n=1 Tax=Weissella ceti TaxID=759620 RepID=A0ABT3E396_9LACO|nr:SepM family pheromone-processing serine protease [Weissella ceti]MCW0952876.1 PDZ domain-containing protein [Weissella ceti]